MRPRIFAAASAALLLCLTLDAVAQDPAIDEGLEQVKESLARIAAENMRGADIHETNGFRVEASDNAELGADFKPNGNRFQQLHITSPGVFRTIVEKGRQGSLGGSTGVFHRDSGERMFSAWDHAEIWHIDRWYRIEKRGAQRGVMLDGELVELERQGNRPIVPQR